MLKHAVVSPEGESQRASTSRRNSFVVLRVVVSLCRLSFLITSASCGKSTASPFTSSFCRELLTVNCELYDAHGNTATLINQCRPLKLKIVSSWFIAILNTYPEPK